MRNSAVLDLKELAGNWKSFPDFCWYDRPEDADNWAIFYISSRDSNLLPQSNAYFIENILKVYVDDVEFQRHTHFAFGYVTCAAVRGSML